MAFGACGGLPPYFHYFHQNPEKVIFSILLVFFIFRPVSPRNWRSYGYEWVNLCKNKLTISMPFGAYGRLPYFHYFQKPEKVIFSILLARMEDCHLISIISTKNQKRSISLFYKFFFHFETCFPQKLKFKWIWVSHPM